jgi:hypothetical protein
LFPKSTATVAQVSMGLLSPTSNQAIDYQNSFMLKTYPSCGTTLTTAPRRRSLAVASCHPPSSIVLTDMHRQYRLHNKRDLSRTWGHSAFARPKMFLSQHSARPRSPWLSMGDRQWRPKTLLQLKPGASKQNQEFNPHNPHRQVPAWLNLAFLTKTLGLQRPRRTLTI